MARWALILIAAGVLLAPAAVGAGEFASPFGRAATQADSKQEQARGTFSTTRTGTGQTPPAAGAIGSGSITGTDSYRIGPGDVIEISVYGIPELTVSVKVGADGNIQLPVIGPTPAAGKTAEELQQDLTARLGADYLQNPQVSVLLTEFNSRFVILTGAIRNGVVPLKGETTLLQLIASQGGVNPDSDSTVMILRERGGKRMAARFDVSAIEKGRAKDVVLQSGDRIVVGESMMKKAYAGFLAASGLAGRFSILPF